MTKLGWTSISAAVTTKQKEDLERKAKECGMTPSGYIKAKLFLDDNEEGMVKLNSKSLRNYDKDLILASARNYTLLQLITKKLASEKDIKEAFDMADKMLIKKGYKDS